MVDEAVFCRSAPFPDRPFQERKRGLRLAGGMPSANLAGARCVPE
ncbi:MAG: hypothetical protein RIS70_2647 [Planctomycetota bacterium]|jgi:hypothetical protein